MTIFIFCFLPTVLILFTLACRFDSRLGAPILLLASLVFYCVADLAGLPLLLLSIGLNFWLTGRIRGSQHHPRRWMRIGVALNLLPLFIYKYVHQGPATSEAAGIFVLGNIPLGLSFYTFQQISCLVDIRKHNAPRLGLMHHALFTSFFAQIPAGPISHYRYLAPQIASVGKNAVSGRNFSAGVSLFALGLAKKLLIAGKLQVIVDHFYDQLASGTGLSVLQAWVTAWAFLLQLYFDFSGYSDMALGVGLCCGISLPPNFNSPLKSLTGSEFVDRWHMSLVSWIREYLYQPLFNRLRKLPLGSGVRQRTTAWAIGTIVSMAVIGAWHGSQVAFLIGGTVGGILLVLRQLGDTLLLSREQKKRGAFHRGVLKLVSLITLSIFVISIRAKSTATCFAMLRAMADWRSVVSGQVLAGLHTIGAYGLDLRSLVPHPGVDRLHEVILLAATLIVLYLPNTMQMFGILPSSPSSAPAEKGLRLAWRPTPAWGIAIGCLLVLEIFFGGINQQAGFIYAKF